MSDDRPWCRICVVMFIVVAVVFDVVWLIRYYTHITDILTLIRDVKLDFGIQDMHVVMVHVGNYSTLSLYNLHLIRHGRTDGLQIGNPYAGVYRKSPRSLDSTTTGFVHF